MILFNYSTYPIARIQRWDYQHWPNKMFRCSPFISFSYRIMIYHAPIIIYHAFFLSDLSGGKKLQVSSSQLFAAPGPTKAPWQNSRLIPEIERSWRKRMWKFWRPAPCAKTSQLHPPIGDSTWFEVVYDWNFMGDGIQNLVIYWPKHIRLKCVVFFNGYSVAIQNWCDVMCNVGCTQCHKPSPPKAWHLRIEVLFILQNWRFMAGESHILSDCVRLCFLILSGGARRSQSVGLCPAFVRPKIFRCGDGFDDSHRPWRPWVIFGWLVYWNPFLLTCSIFVNYYYNVWLWLLFMYICI